MDRKIRIEIFDQYRKPMIRIRLEKVDREKIEPILKEYIMVNAFAEGWFSLFKKKLEEKFREIGAVGIDIERTNQDEINQDHINISSWEINDLGESPLNGYLDSSPSN